MDQLTCEIRFAEDETRESPGRLLSGVLLTYGEIASDRKELFEPNSLRFPDGGLWINDSHDRRAPILRAMPKLEGRALLIDAPIPNTQRGRDIIVGLQSDPPLYTGLSLEFKAEREVRRNGLRVIQKAFAPSAAIVDVPSYKGSTVEVRERSGPFWELNREAALWLYQ